MTVSLTVVVGIVLGYCASIVFNSWMWRRHTKQLERVIVGQDRIIEYQRETIEELHDAVFLIANDDEREPVSQRVH